MSHLVHNTNPQPNSYRPHFPPTRTLYDEYGNPYVCLDEWMKHHLENKLIQAIVGLG